MPSQPHTSLSLRTNLVLIPLWGAAAIGLFYFGQPRPPLALAVVGVLLGAVGGVMQHWSLRQASEGFSTAASLLEVRRAFKSTAWGRRYLIFLYVSKGILLGASVGLVPGSALAIVCGYLFGYFTLMFTREIVTLRDTFFLAGLGGGAGPAEEPGKDSSG